LSEIREGSFTTVYSISISISIAGCTLFSFLCILSLFLSHSYYHYNNLKQNSYGDDNFIDYIKNSFICRRENHIELIKNFEYNEIAT